MASITETLSGLQDQVLDLIKTVQEPAVDAVEKVVETVEGVIPADRPSLPFVDSLPNPAESIDKAFGLAEQLVDGQHDFVKAILANQREFAKWEGGAGDGLAVDNAGRIYVSGETVRVISPDGKELGAIPTPFGTTSVAFGGPDKKTLYAVGGANVDGARPVQLIGIPMIAPGIKNRAK